jgi:DNA-binding CsgD family transcriptional regulator
VVAVDQHEGAPGALVIDFAGRVSTRSSAEGGFWIGRGRDCLLWVPDSLVSSHHAEVVPRQGGRGTVEWGVLDHSRNGTWVDDGRTRLGPGVHWFSHVAELRLYDARHGPRIRLSIDVGLETTLDVGSMAFPRLVGVLAPGDREVLAGLRAGLSDRAIATKLHLSSEAVTKRLQRLRDKLELHAPEQGTSRVELAQLAESLGVEPLR